MFNGFVEICVQKSLFTALLRIKEQHNNQIIKQQSFVNVNLLRNENFIVFI